MDETIRIYNPAALHAAKKSSKSHAVKEETKESKWKKFVDYVSDVTVWKEVYETREKETRELNQKYPWIPIGCNWLIVLLIAALFASFAIWGVNVHTERIAVAYAEAVAEQKDAEHQAYIAQQEADKKAAEKSLENTMNIAAQIKAKVGYGSRNFIDVYNYGDADFMTLYQCMDNRQKNPMYDNMTVKEMFFTEGQFIAAYDTNPVQDYYFNLAMKSERLKHEREVEKLPEPVGTDYIYTIYTPHGIYLANDPGAPAYTWWRYSE